MSPRTTSTSQRWLHPLRDAVDGALARDAHTLGGKGARLAWLLDRGYAVPQTWVLPARAFLAITRVMPPGYELRSLLRAAGTHALHQRIEEARRALAETPLPKGLDQELQELAANAGDSPWGLAVRSSATSEDGQLVSMAGLARSVLGVRSHDQLVHAVREVWASLYDPTALAYLRNHGVRDVAMGVVVQRVVPARAAGVFITPFDAADPQGIVVNATLGLGTSVVDGSETPDLYRIDFEGRTLESTLARGKRRVVVERPGHDAAVDVDTGQGPLRSESAAEGASLESADLDKIATLARRLHASGSGGWDVEFAFEDAELVVLQARPVTARRLGRDINALYTNANVGEALPGVATPLTWSVAGNFAEAGFRRAFATLGCKMPRGTSIVTNVHGRFYLDLTAFLHVVRDVPWLDAASVVELAGGDSATELEAPARGTSTRGLVRLPFIVKRVIDEQLQLDRQVERFEQDISLQVDAHRALDLEILPDEGIAKRLRDLGRLLDRTGTIMLTCAATSLGSHLGLRALFADEHDPDGKLGSVSVVQGIRDLESARPAFALMAVARAAQADHAAAAAIAAGAKNLEDLEDGPCRRALRSFLDLYGHRAIREAELATPRWHEDPAPLFAMLRVSLRDSHDASEVLLRSRVETAARTYEKRLAQLSFARRRLVLAVAPHAQKATRYRERMRGWVVQVLGMIREVALAADRRLARLMPELETERARWAGKPGHEIPNVFFLTTAEIIETLRASYTDLVPVVRSRRGEYLRNLRRPEPPVTFRGSPPGLLAPTRSNGRLLGMAASSGIATGPARVITDLAQLDDFEPGDILVTHATDVGWTPLFPCAAGVVTELGGSLSHAAIVARELGVPSVVNVKGATLVIHDGDLLRVDGDRGTVEIIAAETS